MDKITDPKLQQILKHLKNWKFEFQGFDENATPLVVAPNGQIVEVNVAIKFVNEEIAKLRTSHSSGSPETMPNIPDSLEKSSKTESGIERAIELEQPQETKTEKTDSNSANDDLVVKVKAPAIKLVEAQRPKPYGDGFDPKTFDPTDVVSTENFINNNIGKNAGSSSKWLAVQFKKFLEEYKNTK